MTTRSASPIHVVVLLVLAIHAQISSAGQFHSTSYGYSLDLPEGWVQIPRDAIEAASSMVVKKDRKTTIIYDAGFQPDGAKDWFELPYVLVQAIPYAQFGIHRQINENEFADFIRGMTGVGADQIVDEYITSEAGKLVDDIDLNHPKLDMAKRRYLRAQSVNVKGIGEIRALNVGYFGREAIIQLTFNSRDADWTPHASARRAILDSFTFDPNKAYVAQGSDPSHSAPETGKRGSGPTIAVAIIILLIVGLPMVIVTVFSLRYRTSVGIAAVLMIGIMLIPSLVSEETRLRASKSALWKRNTSASCNANCRLKMLRWVICAIG